MNEWKRILIMMFVRDLMINNKLKLASQNHKKRIAKTTILFNIFAGKPSSG